jgi:hypothetical protein
MSDTDKATKASQESDIKSEIESSEDEFFPSHSDKESSAFEQELLTRSEVEEVIKNAKVTQLERNLTQLSINSIENLPALAAEILNTSNHFYYLLPPLFLLRIKK